jgi:hypothetical protein
LNLEGLRDGREKKKRETRQLKKKGTIMREREERTKVEQLNKFYNY